MAAVCEVCGKRPWFGKQVSHSHRRSSKKWSPNIQRLKVLQNDRVRRIDVCTSCIKAGKVQRAPIKARG